jgi:hypothetical protein
MSFEDWTYSFVQSLGAEYEELTVEDADEGRCWTGTSRGGHT